MGFKKRGNSFFGFTLIELLVANRRIRRVYSPTFLIAFAVIGLAGSVLSSRPVLAEGAPVRTMSFNVREDDGTRTTRDNAWVSTIDTSRRDLAIQVVNDFDPDILGVQEAHLNQVNDLQGGLPGHGFYGVGRDDGVEGGEFMGIYYRSSRFTQTNQGTFWLTDTPDVPGSMCQAVSSPEPPIYELHPGSLSKTTRLATKSTSCLTRIGIMCPRLPETFRPILSALKSKLSPATGQ